MTAVARAPPEGWPRFAGKRRRASKIAVLAALVFLVGSPAIAGAGASASVWSDDIFRGASLSDGRPVATLDLSYDHPTGAYIGGSVTGVLTAHSGPRWLSIQGYAGYAPRLSADLTADVGVTYAQYTEYYAGRSEATYGEAYVGLTSGRVSSRLYYSPRYFGARRQTLYAELEGAVQPKPNWRLTWRVGMLTPLGGGSHPLLDWRLGLSREVRGFDLQLALSGAQHERGAYDRARVPRGTALVVGVTRGF